MTSFQHFSKNSFSANGTERNRTEWNKKECNRRDRHTEKVWGGKGYMTSSTNTGSVQTGSSGEDWTNGTERKAMEPKHLLTSTEYKLLVWVRLSTEPNRTERNGEQWNQKTYIWTNYLFGYDRSHSSL